MTSRRAGPPAAILVLALVAACARRPAAGTLELRWRLSDVRMPGVVAVELAPASGGANVGPVRDGNWTNVPVVARAVRLSAVDDGSVVVARGDLPSGRYDRVHAAATVVTATLASGVTTTLVSHIEPIARGFELSPGGTIAVEIELVVLPGSSAGDGRGEVFVRDARLAVDGDGAGAGAVDRR